jgi:phosphomethylpyrimidine synthase
MKITQDIREFAAKHGVDEDKAIDVGMKEKSAEFKRGGAEVYQ